MKVENDKRKKEKKKKCFHLEAPSSESYAVMGSNYRKDFCHSNTTILGALKFYYFFLLFLSWQYSHYTTYYCA